MPEEDREVWEQYKKDYEEYMREHNPDMYIELADYREMREELDNDV